MICKSILIEAHRAMKEATKSVNFVHYGPRFGHFFVWMGSSLLRSPGGHDDDPGCNDSSDSQPAADGHVFTISMYPCT